MIAPQFIAPFGLEVRVHPVKGRGIYASRAFEAGEVIEVSPVSIIDGTQAELLESTPLGHHYFHWHGEDDDTWLGAIAFGLVSLANHAEDHNAGVWPDYERQALVLEALRPIEAGEEITLHYDTELWFDAH